MTKKRIRNKSTGRNYRAEYDHFQGTPAQIKARAQRNAARAKMVKAGKAYVGDGKDIDHKMGLAAGNGKKNLRAQRQPLLPPQVRRLRQAP
jgi:predicted nucleotide-binding protein